MIKMYLQLARDIVHGFVADRCFRTASALAFSTLFALVPILVLVLLVFNALPASDGVHDQITRFLLQNFVTHSADTIQYYMGEFVEHSKHLSVVGLFVLVCTAVLMVFTMERAFDEIWRVTQSRRGVSGFFMYWSVLTLLPVLVSVSLFVVSSLSTWTWLQTMLAQGGVHASALALLPFGLVYVVLFLLYLTLPNCKVPVPSALLSSLVATICFFVGRYGYILYTNHVTMQFNLYGALSVLPIFLFWVYCNWVIVLLGVEVGYHYALFRQQQQQSTHHAEP